MNCEEIWELLSASLDGELSPDQEALLTAHLDQCPECRALREELLGIHQACGELAPAVPADLKERVMANLPARKVKGKVVYWKRWGALAAALILVALAAWRLPHGLLQGPEPSPAEDSARTSVTMSLKRADREDGEEADDAGEAETMGAVMPDTLPKASLKAARKSDAEEAVPAADEPASSLPTSGAYQIPRSSSASPAYGDDLDGQPESAAIFVGGSMSYAAEPAYCGVLTLSDFVPDKDYPAEEPFPGGVRYTLPAADFQALVKTLGRNADLRLTGPDIDLGAPWGLVVVINGER